MKSFKIFKQGSTLLLLFTLLSFQTIAHAESFDSVSHIHQIKVYKNKVLLGTHEGLFEFSGKNSMKRISSEDFDVMGLAIVGGKIIASGHPNRGSKLPAPIGLIQSTNFGKKWALVSLGGKADFHLLDGLGKEIYGADSQSGNLMYSDNSGKSWVSVGSNVYSDLALSPNADGSVIALQEDALVYSKNHFKSVEKVVAPKSVSQIEWTKNGILALSGSALYQSSDYGKTWTLLSKLPGEAGILSANENLSLVTIGSAIYLSTNQGKTFKKS